MLIYEHPWARGGLIGIGILAGYQFWWRPEREEYLRVLGDPAPLSIAVLAAMLMGQALAMIFFLLEKTRSAGLTALRPTRGRIISAICLGLVTPIVVIDWLPWIVLGFLPFVFADTLGSVWLWSSGVLWIVGLSMLVVYSLACLIQHHTYQRKWLRFGLFCLYFWGLYGFHILWRGLQHFL